MVAALRGSTAMLSANVRNARLKQCLERVRALHFEMEHDESVLFDGVCAVFAAEVVRERRFVLDNKENVSLLSVSSASRYRGSDAVVDDEARGAWCACDIRFAR